MLGLLLTSLFPFLLISGGPVPSKTDITLLVKGIEGEKATLIVVLYDSPQTFLSQEAVGVFPFDLSTQKNPLEVVLPQLASGTYALVAYIDENDNQQLDRTFIGLPKEPIGFSETTMGMFGPPSFNKAKFKVPTIRPVEVLIERH